jgi:hypothetical protein
MGKLLIAAALMLVAIDSGRAEDRAPRIMAPVLEPPGDPRNIIPNKRHTVPIDPTLYLNKCGAVTLRRPDGKIVWGRCETNGPPTARVAL